MPLFRSARENKEQIRQQTLFMPPHTFRMQHGFFFARAHAKTENEQTVFMPPFWKFTREQRKEQNHLLFLYRLARLDPTQYLI